MIIHFVGGFGKTRGARLKGKELLAMDAAFACYPEATIYAWTDAVSWPNLPAYAIRKTVSQEFYSSWPNVELVKGEHMSDKVRLFALLEYGGLYLDTDVYCMKRANFHNHKLQMANESFHNNTLNKLNNGTIYAPQANNKFLSMWWEAYEASSKEDFSSYVGMSCKLPVELANKWPELIDIKPCKQWLGDAYIPNQYAKPFNKFPKHIDAIEFWHLRRSGSVWPIPKGSYMEAITALVCKTWGLKKGKYTNVVVLSAGLGSRLSPLTDNLPKCLVPISGKAALLWQYEYYVPKYTDKLIVIAHSKYRQALISFANLNNLKLDIRAHDEADGSASAIYATCKDLKGQPVVFNWSDILPIKLSLANTDSNIVFLGKATATRYSLRSSKLVEEATEKAGVIGIYYHSAYEPIELETGKDFADLPIEYEGAFCDYEDFGDLAKLSVAKMQDANLSSGRYTVHKGNDGWFYKNSDSASLEYNWYEKFQPGFAEMLSPNAIRTKAAIGFKLKYSPVYANRLIDKLKCQAWHGKVSPICLAMETIAKLYKRLDAFKGIIPLELEAKAKELMLDALIRLTEISNNTLVLQGHFDLNGENVFIDNSTEPCTYTLIDPRGYFGRSSIGPLAYEISKVYYGFLYWNHLAEYDIINKKPISPIKLANMQLSEEETLWLKVHLLTGFGVLNTNPVLAIDALAYGLQLIEEL